MACWTQSPINPLVQYLFVADIPGMTRSEAQDFCSKEGGFLAEPITQEENDFLNMYLSGLKGNFWIGLWHCSFLKSIHLRSLWTGLVREDYNFIWERAGVYARWTRWGEGEPSVVHHKCVALKSLINLHWNDLSCNIREDAHQPNIPVCQRSQPRNATLYDSDV